MANNKHSIPTTLIILALIAFGAVSAFILPLIFSGISYDEPYAAIARVCLFAGYSMLVVALGVLLTKGKRSRVLYNTLWALTAIVWLSLGLLSLGFIQDSLAVHCAGIMGTEITCFESWHLSLSLALLHPYVLVPGSVILLILLLVGVWQSYDPSQDRRNREQ